MYEITWILYQLCHLGPITWATEQDGHSCMQWKERTTFYTAAVFILYTGPVKCSQNAPFRILSVRILLQRTLFFGGATVELLKLLLPLLIATMHSPVAGCWEPLKGTAASQPKVSSGSWTRWSGITGSRREHDDAWHSALSGPVRRDHDTLISVKYQLYPKNFHFQSVHVTVYTWIGWTDVTNSEIMRDQTWFNCLCSQSQRRLSQISFSIF